MDTYTCPNAGDPRTPDCGTFSVEASTKTSQSAYDKAVPDAAGQHPTMLDQLDAQGVALLVAQRDLLATIRNPSWARAYERVVLDDPVDHEIAVCPGCGTPVKVG